MYGYHDPVAKTFTIDYPAIYASQNNALAKFFIVGYNKACRAAIGNCRADTTYEYEGGVAKIDNKCWDDTSYTITLNSASPIRTVYNGTADTVV